MAQDESSFRGRVARLCPTCGAPFVAKLSQVAQGRGKYCSPQCGFLARRGRPVPTRRTPGLWRDCPICGKAFRVYPSEVAAGGGQTCSRPCSSKWKRVTGTASPAPVPVTLPAVDPATGERWRPVVGWEGLYEVSAFGRVRNCARGIRRTPGALKAIVPPHPPHQLYPQVSLYRAHRSRAYHLHRLVAEAFLGPRPTGWHVNHIDGVKTNAHLTNLEYVSPRENIRHAYRLGLNRGIQGEDNPQHKLTSEDVRAIRCLHAAGFPLVYIGALFGVDGKHVWRIAKREKWAHVP